MSTSFAPAAERATRGAIFWAVAWAIVGAAAIGLLGVLATDVWPKRPEMGDRFLVPIASGVLVYRLRPRWRTTPKARTWTGLPAVAVGATAFAIAWYLLVLVGPRTLLLWWLAMALGLAGVGLLATSNGWRRTAIVVFPLLFALFALPTPDTLQSLLLKQLKGMTTEGAATVLPWLGVPAVRSGTGFTLTLPTGKLGVVDACSGALSLTSLLAIAVLTAYVRFTFRRDFTAAAAIALVVLTVPIVVVSNTVRVIATGILQENLGPRAIQGAWHEILGYLVILVGFGLIVGTSQLLAAKKMKSDKLEGREFQPETSVPSACCSNLTSILAVGLLAPAAGFCLWAESFRQGQMQFADFNAVRTDLSPWDGRSEPVPPDVAEMLKCDQLVLREYENHLGQKVQVYIMFWATPASTAHMHHPDVCWPSRGCSLAESRVRPVTYAPNQKPVGVSVRHYDTAEGNREIVFYWTQNGNEVLPDGQEPADRTYEYGWVKEMLFGRKAPERVSRISVLLAAEVPVGQPADQEERLASLSGQIAAEVFRVCPWATPGR